jgi:exodeoxyribonuclease X
MIRCVDLETTGLPDDGPCGIVQYGYSDLRFGIVHAPVAEFVKCEIPCSIGARAVHHISDAEIASGIKPDRVGMILQEGNPDHFAAHNIDHEKKYFSGGDRPWLCTYKTALRIWPDAPGHKLMELRYFLDIDADEDFNPELAMPPHRAPADAYVCAFVLKRILEQESIETLVKWSSGPALLYMCWMKKYKGTPWRDVPADYLDWILNKSDITDRDIRATAKYYYNLKMKRTDNAQDPPISG